MLRILIADDHDVVRRGVRRVLEAQPGWQVSCEAASGDGALEQAERHRPDVAVLDAFMPGLDGISATRAIRARVPQAEVLVFTMHESDELVAEVLAAGAHGFVLKTDPARFLVAAVESLARHAPYVTPTVADALVRTCGPRRAPRASGEHTPLSGREREIVRLLAYGRANRDIARELGISVKTVETHRANVMRKLEVSSIVDVVRYAVRNRLVQA